MNFAKKLRDVVASNFIEIAREGSNEEKPPGNAIRPEPPVTAGALSSAVRPPAESAPHFDWTGMDLTEFVSADGTVDFDRVLSHANLPRLGFTAEQVAKVLAALPNDLPMRVKRVTVKATLEAVDRDTVIDSQDMVADAMLKKVHIAQYRDALRIHVETLRQENAAEIARLQAEIDRLKEASGIADEKRRAAESACDDQMALMENVVVFFQSETAPSHSLSAADDTDDTMDEEDDELPPFMRDDAVFRMLGLDPVPADAEEVVPSVGTAPSRTGRFAVADSIEA